MKLLRHPLSSAFGQMSQEEFDGLECSCLGIGIQEPICLFEGQVLDGWHRYRIAEKHDLSVKTFVLPDGIDPVEYVLAKNKERRHLSSSQIALAVAEVHKWKPTGRPPEKKNSAANAEFHEKPATKTTKELAQIAGVGTRTMESAKVVVKNAAPEVKEAVREGKLSVGKAAVIATSLPKSEQVVAIIDPTSAPAMAVKEQQESAKPAHAKSKPDEKITFDADKVAELQDQIATLTSMLTEVQADLDEALLVIAADPGAARLKEAMAENKRFRDHNRTLEDRIRGLQMEKNAAIQQATGFKRQLDKAQREARRATH